MANENFHGKRFKKAAASHYFKFLTLTSAYHLWITFEFRVTEVSGTAKYLHAVSDKVAILEEGDKVNL